MNGKANLATLLLLAAVSVPTGLAEVQIPPAFEIVQITDDDDPDMKPLLNNCGQVVWSKRINQDFDHEEIFVWDNGIVVQLTDNDVRDAFPDINDLGTITWSQSRAPGGYEDDLEIVTYRRREIIIVTNDAYADFSPRINNLDHIAWYQRSGPGCPPDSEDGAIYFFDGVEIQLIMGDDFTNQTVAINDFDEMTWTRYDFCHSPWTGTIILYSGGTTIPLTEGASTDQNSDLNEQGQVSWSIGYGGGIARWEDGATDVISPWGEAPELNNTGDIAFHRWHADQQTYQVWLWRNGEFLQLTDSLEWDANARPNDYGEVCWTSGRSSDRDVLLLRIKPGDPIPDGQIDSLDHAFLVEHMTGPIEVPQPCLAFDAVVDWDSDGDIDLRDYAHLQEAPGNLADIAELVGCLTGPLPPVDRCCLRFVDIDGDRDVDLRDYVRFQELFAH